MARAALTLILRSNIPADAANDPDKNEWKQNHLFSLLYEAVREVQ